MCVHRTRAVSVEFSLYNINTDLLAVFSFQFEFPVSERAQSSLDLLVITLWPITGLDLQLLLVVILGGNPSDKLNIHPPVMSALCNSLTAFPVQRYAFLSLSWSSWLWCCTSWCVASWASSERVTPTCCQPGDFWASVNWLWQRRFAGST